MIRFVLQSAAVMLVTLSYRVLCAFLLMVAAVAYAQKPKDALRRQVDSLNVAAADDPEGVLRATESLMGIAKKRGRTRDYGLLLMVKGVAETSQGNNTSALEHHVEAYGLFDSINDNSGKIYSLCNIAAVHLNVEEYRKAEDYLLRALAITSQKDLNNLKNVYVNLGVVYQYSGDLSKAVNTYKKTIPVLLSLKDYNGLATAYSNLGECYKQLDDFAEAENNWLKALGYQRKSGSRSILAIISLSLGSLYTDYGHTEKALKYLEEGGKVAEELDSPYYRDIYYQSMAEYHKANGTHKAEAGYLNRLLRLRDSMHANELETVNSELEGKFRHSLKTKEIEILKTQKKLDESAIERNRTGWMVFCIISVLCIIIIMVLYRNYKLKQKANLLLGREKTELEEQNLLLENENILVQFETLRSQVSPHFLFNSLNALASLIKDDPDKALEFTGVFSKIFRNTLELKDRHLITVGEEIQHVQSYLYLQKMRFGDSLKVHIDVPSPALKLYLPPFSLQMVVENAIKHNVVTVQQPLAIHVTVVGKLLVVANNFSPRQHVEDSTGIGLKNIASRYKYLDTAAPAFGVRNNEYVVELPLIDEE